MKKISLLVLSLTLFFVCFSQNDSKDSLVIPQVNGKVVFSDTILTSLSKSEMQTHISNWLENDFLPGRGVIASNDPDQGLISCRMFDYLEIEKKALSIFAYYMPYSLIFQFEDNRCIIFARDIKYLELADLSENFGYSKKDLIAGETVLLEQTYRQLLVKNASQRMTLFTVTHVNEIFEEVKNTLKS